MTDRRIKETERVIARPVHGPMMSGIVGQKPMDFKGSAKRLLGLLRPYRVKVVAVLVLAVVSVVLAVLAPKMLGWATDEIFSGFVGSQLPAGIPKETVVEGLRAQGEDTLARMLESMDVVPGRD